MSTLTARQASTTSLMFKTIDLFNTFEFLLCYRTDLLCTFFTLIHLYKCKKISREGFYSCYVKLNDELANSEHVCDEIPKHIYNDPYFKQFIYYRLV